MKKLMFLVLLIAATSASATDVGVSVQVGDPNFYGRIDIGNFPPPRVIYREPILIERVQVVQEPVYLHVPPGHAKKWRKHCHKYNACGRPVYFVQESWYQKEYVPEYRKHHGHPHDDHRHDDDRVHGHGKGQGKGHGKGHH